MTPSPDYMARSAIGGLGRLPSGPPPPAYGGLLPQRIIQSPGSVINVSSISALTTALNTAANGSIINITANLNGGGSSYNITRVATAAAPITITRSPGVLLTNFFYIQLSNAKYIRLLDLDVGTGPQDGIKITEGSDHVDIDHCHVHGALRQGINVQPGAVQPTNIQIWNCEIHNCGSTAPGNQDHGIYFDPEINPGNGNVIANNLVYDCDWGYGFQLYHGAPGVIVTCNTIDGGVGRGGIVIGSESGMTDNIQVVGLIGTNAAWYAIDYWDPTSGSIGNTAKDCLGFGNGNGDFISKASSIIAYTNCTHGDPLYVNRAAKNYHLQAGSPAIGKIQPAQYGLVPPLDRDGNPRITADAGCYRA